MGCSTINHKGELYGQQQHLAVQATRSRPFNDRFPARHPLLPRSGNERRVTLPQVGPDENNCTCERLWT